MLTQLGVGGILVLLVLDRVFSFLKDKAGDDKDTAGGQTCDFWQQANKRTTSETLDASVIPILRAQTVILERLEARTGQNYEIHLKHSFMLEAQEKALDKMRGSLHLINEALQVLTGRHVDNT